LRSCLSIIQKKKLLSLLTTGIQDETILYVRLFSHRCLSLRMGSNLFALMEAHFKGKGKKLLILSVWIQRCCLQPHPPTHPFVVFSPLFLFHMSNNSQIWFNVYPFYTFYFQKGEGCNNWNYCWRCWFRLLVCSECYFCGAPKISFRIASGP